MKKTKIKKIEIHDTDTEGSWAISYGDMITLLLSFFVIFFSFDFSKEKEQKLEVSAMKNIALMDTFKEKNTGIHEKESVAIEELNEITTIVKKEKDGKLVVFFKGANFFDTGATSVNDFGQVLLSKFIKNYVPYAGKFRVKIQAFTDSTPVTNPNRRYRDNVELSAMRSISVMRYLQTNGVPLNRVEIGGMGIMSDRVLAVLGLDTKNIIEKRKMSRTIALILFREDAS
jgi:flagellar motor protein MotB